VILARAAESYDFILFEYFQSDKAGHSADMALCRAELTKLEEFVDAALEACPPGTLLVVTSDHGNLEDLSTRRHTTNPVPLMAWGPDAAEFVAGIARLDQVTPALVSRHS